MTEYAGYLASIEAQIVSTWTTVAQVRDINGPAFESDQIEVSSRVSRFRRYVAGMADGGEVTIEVVFDPDHASHDPTLTGSMYNLAETGAVNNFRINFPGVSTAVTRAAFSAFVSNFSVKSPLEDGLMADLTLKITGTITWSHIP